MNQSPDFDVVILGGGMTGLTLAHHIAQQNAAQPTRALNTLVLEPRGSYRRDKTWCYWQQISTPFDEAITHQWSQWSVSFNGETQVCRSEHKPYVRVDSGRFYDIAQREIEVSDSVTLRLGEAATAMTAHQAGVVITSARASCCAKKVFDTRPKPLPEDILLQHFVGWEIETESDVFDPSTVILMDFVSTAQDIHFFYVLPFSPRHALVETTHFSKVIPADEIYAGELETYLASRFGLREWRTLHREQGVIPMPRKAPDLAARAHRQIVPLGLHSDTVKPSTGYCYPHAQQQALAQVRALFARPDANPNTNPQDHAVAARSRLNRWLDAVFIGYLEEHPERAGEIFYRLFSRVPSNALVRFLSDQARPTDVIRVMTALPMGAFIRQAFRHVVSA